MDRKYGESIKGTGGNLILAVLTVDIICCTQEQTDLFTISTLFHFSLGQFENGLWMLAEHAVMQCKLLKEH